MLWGAKGIKIPKNTKIEKKKTSVKESNKEITEKAM